MKQNFKLTTPVLFLVFNRPDTTKKVFEEIQKARPKQLFIAGDGPRTKEEKKKTDAVRKYILDNIDWKCKIKTLFRDKNLGCKYAVAGAIDWFFENVEKGIILEDDCLPSQSFFRFCQEMLERYEDDERVMQISGTNIEGKSKINEDYFFSNYFNAWGWATWRRAWKEYDVDMKKFIKIKKSTIQFENAPFSGWKGKRLYSLLRDGKIDTWDYQWIYSCIINSGKCIIPKVNLIENLGFFEGTHTADSHYQGLKRSNIKWPFSENEIFLNNKGYQKAYAKFFAKGQIKRFLKNIIK